MKGNYTSMKMKSFTSSVIIAVVLAALPLQSQAHCDTMDGPVVTDAKQALEKGDVIPVLKWVKKAQESEIRAAFARTLAVRKQSAEAKDLADLYFFETLVRVHRVGEDEPYTGLKPHGTPVEPDIAAADRAIAAGSAESLLKDVSEGEAAGVRQRFQRVMESKKHAEESIEAGREYVEAYVQFIHHAEHEGEAAETKGVQHPTDTHSGGSATIGETEAKQALEKLERDWADAVKRRDVEAISRIQADDFEFTGPAGELWTKTRSLDFIKAGNLQITSFELSDFRVRLYDDMAVVNFRVVWFGNSGGMDISGPQRMTDVWAKRDGRWQCVASHTTRIPPQ